MTRRDRFTVGLLGFFLLIAGTIELYFLRHSSELVARAPTELFAHLLQIYSAADSAYFHPVSALALSFEGVNVYLLQPLCVLLIWAIVKQRSYRWPLQLAIGAYLAISVILYFTVGVVSGYDGMARHTSGAFALFYGANAPWLIGYGWIAWDAAVVIQRAFARKPAASSLPAAPLDEEGAAEPQLVPAPAPHDSFPSHQ